MTELAQNLTGLIDQQAIKHHVEMLHELAQGQDGKFVLCAFAADAAEVGASGTSRPQNRVEHFQVGDTAGMTERVAQWSLVPHLNVYCGLHLMRHDLQPGSRGKFSDITSVLGLVVDIDNDAGHSATLPFDAN